MYQAYYGFRQKPFQLTPDPEFFYLSRDHLEALEHLCYGIEGGEGFMLLIGAIGTGKTTLSRVLAARLSEKVVYSLVLNPFQDYDQLLKTVLHDLGVYSPHQRAEELTNDLLYHLVHIVAPAGKTALVIIDEAQNLDDETLEKLRILSNIETDKEKLLQFLLLGQEELLEKLARRNLRQLNQRIAIRYFLQALNRGETARYLNHRLLAATPARPVKFTASAVRLIHKYSGGVPRLINMLANRCLLAGYVNDTATIDRKLVRRAVISLNGAREKSVLGLKKRNAPRQPFASPFGDTE